MFAYFDSEILDEKRFLDITIAEERCVVHFFHKDFGRCGIVDRHLEVSILVTEQKWKIPSQIDMYLFSYYQRITLKVDL